MAIFINGTNVPASNHIYLNSQSAQNVYYNNALVWKRELGLWNNGSAGGSWGFAANQSDGGGGSGANAYASGANLVVTNGINGASARAYCWFDASPWSTLSFTFSGSAQYYQLRWGVYNSTSTGILGGSEVRVTKTDGASGSWNGTYSINVTDLSGGYYAMLYFYSGSVYPGTIYISKVVLS